tara:strand:+ start:347 stop:580 length:234 start_codon:yes stop_codon:yes gene_type:complete
VGTFAFLTIYNFGNLAHDILDALDRTVTVGTKFKVPIAATGWVTGHTNAVLVARILLAIGRDGIRLVIIIVAQLEHQ